MSQRITRQDVAVAAGVSGATVSRVYNSPQLVDSATVERVRAAAVRLGFIPDKNAAALRRRSSGGLLFVEIEGAPPYRWLGQRAYQSLYGEIVRAVLHSVQGSSHSLQLVSLASADEIPSLERYGDFSGILGFDVTDQQVASALAALGRPVVCCHHGDLLTGVSTVCTDNRAGGALQARYLVEEGHRKLAYVTGMKDEVRSHFRRWEGFCEVGRPQLVLDGFLGYADGLRAAKQLATAIRNGEITAIACVNDLTALGVSQGLSAEGLHVPRDAALFGYDNLVLTGLLGPGLPTIEARLPLVYTTALNTLNALVSGRISETHLVIEPVVVRSE